ncbi:hypothetical protein [Pseudomonas sp. NPDC007930]|uniref:hypothetical protein n=1 Tax=Pseudomonas sp. NPDC007930 TaxID=3364417 RepID=UPI0036EF0B68
MNATLFALNAMALAALLSCHFLSDRNDAALVHIDTDHWVQRPVAQRAGMPTQHIRASVIQERAGNVEHMEMAQPAPVERYTF